MKKAVLGLVLSLAPISILAHPGSGIAADRLGRIYFLDTGSGLWRIDPHGRVTRLSRLQYHWLAIDEDGRFAGSPLPRGASGEISSAGTSPTTLLSSDYPIAIGDDGNLYFPSSSSGGVRIMRMSPSGAVSVLATLMSPHVNGLSSGPGGSLYYTDDSSIHRITAQGDVSKVVTVPALAGAPSIPGNKQHPYLRGLAVDPRGVIYVADSGDARVLKITPEGKITTLVQTRSPWSPTAVTISGSDVYVLEFLHTVTEVRRDWLPRVRKISADGSSTIILTVDKMSGSR